MTAARLVVLPLSRACLLLAALGASALSCLPGDSRPPPAKLVVTMTAAGALTGGLPASSTDDGWRIALDRFLVSAGHGSLDGDGCTSYSENHYSRVLDMRLPGPQSVGILYGLGQCDFGFRIANPRRDSLLGNGVTERDKTRMRTPGTDLHETMRGVSVEVAGRATRGEVTKTFAWSFRQQINYRECAAGDGSTRGFALEGNEARAAELVVHGEALFQDGLDAAKAKLRFDPFAEADDRYGDRDGAVTLDELAAAPLPALDPKAGPADAETEGAWETLEDYVYLGLVPAMVRFQGDGRCVVNDRRPDGR